jgi:hypothetical protein
VDLLVAHVLKECVSLSSSFEYTKTVDSFAFNYDKDTDSSQVSSLKPFNQLNNIVCVNCFAYLGASAFVVVDWDGTSLVKALIGVTGEAAFEFDYQITASSVPQSLSTTKTLLSVPKCVGVIVVAGIVVITPTCVLEGTVWTCIISVFILFCFYFSTTSVYFLPGNF